MFLTKHDSSITFDSKLERERERERERYLLCIYSKGVRNKSKLELEVSTS